jgi:hypothetical protein
MSTSIAHSVDASGRTNRPRRWLRSRVWLRRGTLDRMLAEGADPSSSPELAYRAAQLASPGARRSLAAGIARTIEAAEEPIRPLTSAVPLQRREILAARDPLAQLAGDIGSADPVQIRGLALVERLLTDGGSPLYVSHPELTLEDAVRHARAALLLR